MGEMLKADDRGIEAAALALRSGLLVAFPTETVYGLGANARDEQAVRRIFAAKGRPSWHPLIVHLPSLQELPGWAADIPQQAWDLAEVFWPGPLTLVLKKAGGVSAHITGGQGTVALRIPNHAVALRLLRAFERGIAAPSANKFGHISPTRAEHVAEDFADEVAIILDGGPCRVGLESTIVDLSGSAATLLRPGAIDRASLARVLGAPPRDSQGEQTTRVPGMIERHYAPHKPTRLCSYKNLEQIACSMKAEYGVLSLQKRPPCFTGVWIELSSEPERYAKDLYAALRELDHTRAAEILIEEVPVAATWEAIRDRLRRASTQSNN
ncbi:MAG: threonylcarbamoyl-AMP synthase [Trueperaceae bacterium]|nr:MAG: threonylcarbamoyl-AMP synthase [Trueperaceae bacterium]